MAPVAPSNTARFRFNYTCVATQHSVQVRTGASPAAISGFMNAYFTAFAGSIFGITLDNVEFAAVGSDIFNLITSGLEGNTYGVGAGSVEDIPRAYTFIGRSPGGKRVRMVQFGAKNVSSNYRVTSGEQVDIDAVLALLQGLPTHLLAIDGLVPVWKSYANVKEYDHWVEAVRP
jgi:hypothetical protein